MSDQILPPFSDTSDGKSTGTKVLDAVSSTAGHVKDAVDLARQPGNPLDLLSSYARRAPLTSLFLAYLVGMAIARRR